LIDEVLRRILEYAKAEASTEDLQKLPVESYAQLIQELNNKASVASADSEVTGRIEEMVRNGLSLLLENRFRKIARLVREGREIPEDRLLLEERRFVIPLRELRISGRRGEPRDMVIISFRKNFPPLYSVRLMTLGPFSQFDTAVVPRTDAEELVKRNVAEAAPIEERVGENP
jgi:DNA replication factor GINS